MGPVSSPTPTSCGVVGQSPPRSSSGTSFPRVAWGATAALGARCLLSGKTDAILRTMDASPALSLYAALAGARGVELTRAERRTLTVYIATRLSKVEPPALSDAIAEALRLRSEYRHDPMQPLKGLNLDAYAARELLRAACEVGLSEGELSLDQSLALEALREQLGVAEETLADLIDEHMLSRLGPRGGPSSPDDREAPVRLEPDPALWKHLPPNDRLRVLAVVRPYRAMGFFSDQKDWSDEALASALEHSRRRIYTSEELESDWQYLALDLERVWTLDLTGNGSGPDEDVVQAIAHLGRISAGAFTPTRVEGRRSASGHSVSLEVDGRHLQLTDLIDAPHHFDLTLLERLNEALPQLTFCVGCDGDAHHFIVVRREHYAALRRAQLDLYDSDRFEAFRAWARGD